MVWVWVFALGALGDDATFAEGRALYDQLEYEQAVFRFQEVAVRPDLAGADKAVVMTWLGLSYAGTGSMDAARRAFVDAATIDAAVALPVEVAPALQQVFDDARQEAARRRAEQPLPADPPAEHSTSPAPVPSSPAPALPLIGAAAGAAALVGGVGLAGLSWATFEGAKDKQLYQADAKARLDAANVELGVAWALVPAGAAVLAASAWLLVEGGPP